jgi:alanyl-tRNA synthetase
MEGDSIRNSYLNFFEERGHLPMPSASLIPAGDPTLLFTSAGMVPFKPFFMGEQTPPRRRLTSCQKSFRTTDIDEVGDHKHLTFFEMLGNFSIGDYFKKDAVAFAWELCTDLFGLEPERLYVTIHLDDDDAYDLWRNDIGVPPERIYRYGNSDNWWGPAGLEGPTGPCSELHYDGGSDKGIGQHREFDDLIAPDDLTALLRREAAGGPDANPGGCHPNCDCERFVELWNLVFMQFYQDPAGSRTPLPAPSVDTGMGLERAAAILQGKPNVYETDLFRPIVDAVCSLSGVQYGVETEADYAIRVVAEHARAACFLISDGVVPSNSERGYVLRRIIRRAIRYGRQLGVDRPFMTEVTAAVMHRFAAAYPALAENRDFVQRVVSLEEIQFLDNIRHGTPLLEDILHFINDPSSDAPALVETAAVNEADLAAARTANAIPGGIAFVLYDTYGFPPELVDEIARREYGLSVDMDGFNAEMEAKRIRDRAGHQVTGSMEIVTAYENLGAGATAFFGYDRTSLDSRIVGILLDGEAVGHATRGQQVEIVLAETCFYAEGGGQVGDQGVITGPNGHLRVEDTQSPVAGLIVHRGAVVDGDLTLGDSVVAQVDSERRLDASRNHSSTHLLHAALRSVLGPHVRQAGSLCAPGRLRFDFNHVGALTPDEQLGVQALANRNIRANLGVSAQETTYTDAVRDGALAFFGDRYGDVVRVVRMAGHDDAEPFSFEVCGGTHVHATGEVGTLVVLGESSIGGGMRRIEATTGRAAEELFVEQSATLEAISRRLQAPVAELEARLDAYMADTEVLRRRLADAERASLRSEAESLLDRTRDIDGVKLVAGVTSAHNVEAMREMGDFLKQKLENVVVALGAVIDGSPIIVTMITPDLVSRGLHAGNIARDAAKLMGGGGGGRPETAQAGGRQPERLGAALDSVANLVRAGLGN